MTRWIPPDRKAGQSPNRPTAAKPPPPLEAGRKLKVVRHNAPQLDNLHRQLAGLADGRAATRRPGISPLGFRKLAGEIGADLSAWKSEKRVTSWLGFSPNPTA